MTKKEAIKEIELIVAKICSVEEARMETKTENHSGEPFASLAG